MKRVLFGSLRCFSVRRSLLQKIFVTKRFILCKPFSLPCRKVFFQGVANSGFSRGGQNDFCRGKSGEISILPTPGTTQSLAKTLMGKCQISKSRGGLCPPFRRPCLCASVHTFTYSSTHVWQCFIIAGLQLLGLERSNRFRFHQTVLKMSRFHRVLIKIIIKKSKSFCILESEFKIKEFAKF